MLPRLIPPHRLHLPTAPFVIRSATVLCSTHSTGLTIQSRKPYPPIAAAGYTTVQTSPVQQPKDYSTSGDVTGQWWKLYQPISFHIAEKSWLGTKDDLKSLCDEADKYGIKIICDIVSNHIANADEARPETVSNQVKSTSLSSIRKEEPTPVHTKAMQTTVRFRQLFRVMFQSVPTL